MKNIAFVIIASVVLYGCTVSKAVEIKEPTDQRLTCRQIENELFRAESYEERARDAQGVTGTNVAAGLFFLPGLVVTQASSSNATGAARKRQQHLLELAVQKDCDVARYESELRLRSEAAAEAEAEAAAKAEAEADTTEQ